MRKTILALTAALVALSAGSAMAYDSPSDDQRLKNVQYSFEKQGDTVITKWTAGGYNYTNYSVIQNGQRVVNTTTANPTGNGTLGR